MVIIEQLVPWLDVSVLFGGGFSFWGFLVVEILFVWLEIFPGCPDDDTTNGGEYTNKLIYYYSTPQHSNLIIV